MRGELRTWLPYLVVLNEQPEPGHESVGLAQLLSALETLAANAQTDAAAQLQDLLARLDDVRTQPLCPTSASADERVLDEQPCATAWHGWLDRLEDAMHKSLAHEQALGLRMLELAERCAEQFAEMDFRFLYDRARGLFYIGYDTSAQRYAAHH